MTLPIPIPNQGLAFHERLALLEILRILLLRKAISIFPSYFG